MKHFKKLDKFGEKFSFNYNGYDKYSTRVGGLVCLIICVVSLANFILNLIPFVQKENYTLQFYTVNSHDTEKIIFKNSSIFGIDCEERIKTEEAKNYFEINIKMNVHNHSEKTEKKIEKVKCNRADFNFDEVLNNTINNFTINELKIDDFNCLEENENEIKGIYTSSIFSFYKITVSKKEGKNFSEINDFLFENDCKLQFYYIDYTIDIKNYKDPFKPLINSLFLQLNPDFYVKKNVFFMNYHFKTDDLLFHIYQSEKNEKKKEKEKTGFSRVEDYFIYKGVNTSSKLEDKEKLKFATVFIRADNKKMEIKRENQNILDFYAENSAFCLSLFSVLNFFFTIYNGFHANRSMSLKLFFFEEEENNKFNILKRRNSITSNLSLINKLNVNNVNDINDITMTDNEEKDDKNNNANAMPVIYNSKVVNNYIITSDKTINTEETNINKKKTKKEKEIEKEKE